MKVLIDGVDFSRLFYRYGLSIQPKKRYGTNNAIALSGEKLVDLLATKSIITLTCNPLTTAQRDDLAAACAKAEVTLVYNPGGESDEDCTVRAEPTLSAAAIKLKAAGVAYWTGAVVTMEEL